MQLIRERSKFDFAKTAMTDNPVYLFIQKRRGRRVCFESVLGVFVGADGGDSDSESVIEIYSDDGKVDGRGANRLQDSSLTFISDHS